MSEESIKREASLTRVRKYAEQKYQCPFYALSPQRIFFLNKNNSICLCSPYSKFNKNYNHYWIDITERQIEILNNFSKSIIIFRLGYENIFEVDWNSLSDKLDKRLLCYNDREGNHYKLYFEKNFIIIKGNKILEYKPKSIINNLGENNENH
jgi:hypothetical protein